jgi:hypothetical protein
MKDSAAPRQRPSALKRIPLYRWRLHSKTTGRAYISHTYLTEAEAVKKDRQAERLEWSAVWVWVPDSPEEIEPQKLDEGQEPH